MANPLEANCSKQCIEPRSHTGDSGGPIGGAEESYRPYSALCDKLKAVFSRPAHITRTCDSFASTPTVIAYTSTGSAPKCG